MTNKINKADVKPAKSPKVLGRQIFEFGKIEGSKQTIQHLTPWEKLHPVTRRAWFAVGKYVLKHFKPK